MKEVTLGDIAKLAGCSKNTVSLALRGSSRISAKRREEIEKIALSLGYVPHLSARHLSGKRSGYIGVYTVALKDAVRTTLTNRLISGFHGTGLHPILGLEDTSWQSWEESKWILAFRAMRVEAIVILGEVHGFTLPPPPRPVPLVLVHCQPDPSFQCDYIGLDRREAASLGREHLRMTNRKRLIVFGDKNSYFSKGGMGQISAQGRDSSDLTAVHHDLPYVGIQEMSELAFDFYIAHRGEFDSALFQDAGVAAGFINLSVEAGIKIPDEIAIIAYDFYPQAHLLKVSLTTIEQPISELAERAIEMILKRVQRPNTPWMHEVLPHTLNLRDSC